MMYSGGHCMQVREGEIETMSMRMTMRRVGLLQRS